ncbi:MAG: HAMP domain-containing protein, partial [Desulfobacterales bacterium]|nr:HAMP domain-containing protein [Desulfobacterales bacterium]
MSNLGGRPIGWLQVVANFAGACIVTSYFVFFDRVFPAQQIQNTFYVVGIMFVGLVIIAGVFFYNWRKDLNRFFNLKRLDQEIDPVLQKNAQRKILDLPYISALMSLFNWFLAAITMTTYSLISESGEGASFAVQLVEGLRVFIGVIIAGIITCAIIFFTTESQCKKIWSDYFPRGGVATTQGTFRLKLRIRMFVIFLLASILPLILMAVLSYNKARMMLVMDPAQVIQSLLYLTGFLLAVTLTMAIILSRQFTTGIIDPVRRMEAAMAKVAKGNLTATVTVNSNDELGALAENFNQMTEGLKDRYRLQQSLDLAKEVQQNLLPEKDP